MALEDRLSGLLSGAVLVGPLGILAVNVDIEGKVCEPCDGELCGGLETASHGRRFTAAVSMIEIQATVLLEEM